MIGQFKLMTQKIDGNIKKITIFYILSFIVLIVITSLFEPFAYAFGYLMIGRGRFADFYDIVNVAKEYPNIGGYCITPWHYSFYNLFDKLGIGANSLFIFYNAAIIILSGLLVTRLKKFYKINTNSIYFVIFSYPALFGIWRGNTEILSFLLLFLATIYLHQKNSPKSFRWYLASVFIKPNYLINGVMFINSINKKTILQGIFFIAISFLLIFIFDNPKHVMDVSSECLAKYVNSYIVGEGGSLFNNSLYGFIKSILYSLYDYREANNISLKIYFYIIKYWWVPLGGISLYAMRRLSYEAFLFIVLAGFVFLYPISADYRLATLCIPLFFMVITNYEKWKFVIYIVLIIMLPKHIIWFRLTELDVNVTLNSFVNPVLLLVAILTVLVKGNNGISIRVN